MKLKEGGGVLQLKKYQNTLKSNGVLHRAVIVGVSWEAVANSSVMVAETTVTALIDIVVGTSSGGEELVYSHWVSSTS